MQAMDADSRRRGRGGQGRVMRLRILAGPGAGTVEEVTAPTSRFGDYIPDATLRMFDADAAAAADDMAAALFYYDDAEDDDLDLAAPLFDDDLDLAGHRRGSKRARVAATSEAILGLQKVAGRSRSGEECAICLQDFHADETLRGMPCSHAFHQHCISQWLSRNAACPLCRHRLPTEEDDEQIDCY
ncbi:unnamed protein product [Urochloa decumbens]|uniref:RING-type domain-containing protein n=2 Tax=Urochloa decumbens TaxID=240449 RepID=A0ABC8VT70_9POAL